MELDLHIPSLIIGGIAGYIGFALAHWVWRR